MKALAECRLYAFVDTGYLQGRSPDFVAQQLCDGGVDLIQLRAKDSSIEYIERMAETILPITRKAGVGFVINDHPEVAHKVGAECCHLGQDDFFESGHNQVSELKPNGEIPKVGLSTHSPEQAEHALAVGADYIAVGPVFATGTKPNATPVTLDYVRWAAANVNIPWFAIGGINLENVDEVLAAGARRICVVSAILNADEIAATCREWTKRL